MWTPAFHIASQGRGRLTKGQIQTREPAVYIAIHTGCKVQVKMKGLQPTHCTGGTEQLLCLGELVDKGEDACCLGVGVRDKDRKIIDALI